ncbi:MAG TPA: RHS repeat-associated core domain-containing protein [Acidimicrobiales bacterium]|jgi:RHS repeat-associated protein|nr:RHS repeat-associated core domain-containing protein [Acidimicrobiales bacterium]
MTKTVNSTTQQMLWDQTATIPLLLSDGTNSYIYGPQNLPLEQINNTTGTIGWYHHDQHGSTRGLTDNTGALISTITYSPYGQATATTGTPSPLGYNAQYTDPETGLIYLRARYYDPTTAQYLTRDPLDAVTRSAYGYVDNNPLNGSDPTGLFCLLGHVHGNHGACRGANATHDVATVGLVLGVAAVVVGTIVAPEVVLPILGAVSTEGLATGLGAAATAIGAYITAVDCSHAVDTQCVIDGLGTALGGASVLGGLGAATGSALDAASPELAQYVRGISNLGLGVSSSLYAAASSFGDQFGLTSGSEGNCR